MSNNMMNHEQPSPLWLRFVVAGQRIRQTAPALWPLVVQLIEGAAEPDALTDDDLRELATIAAHTAWAMPSARPSLERAIPPRRVLADWRMIDSEALAVPLERIEMLTPESLAEIAHWARAVARSRREPGLAHPSRPPIIDQLLTEVQTSSDRS